MTAIFSVNQLKHRDIVGLVVALVTMACPVTMFAYDDLDDYIESEEYLLDYLFDRPWDENPPPPVEALWDGADVDTDSIVFRATDNPTVWDVEIARYEGTDGDPPYQDYLVVGTGMFQEAARFEYRAFSPIVEDAFTLDAEVIAGLLTPTGGVERVIWGVESLYTFTNDGDGDDWLVRMFNPMYILDGLDQAVPDAYAFARVDLPQPGNAKLGPVPSNYVVMLGPPQFPIDPQDRGDHPCVQIARGQLMKAHADAVEKIRDCLGWTAGQAGACAVGCPKLAWPIAIGICLVGCAAYVVYDGYKCLRTVNQWYKGQVLVIHGQLTLCCQQNGGCPERIPMP